MPRNRVEEGKVRILHRSWFSGRYWAVLMEHTSPSLLLLLMNVRTSIKKIINVQAVC